MKRTVTKNTTFVESSVSLFDNSSSFTLLCYLGKNYLRPRQVAAIDLDTSEDLVCPQTSGIAEFINEIYEVKSVIRQNS